MGNQKPEVQPAFPKNAENFCVFCCCKYKPFNVFSFGTRFQGKQSQCIAFWAMRAGLVFCSDRQWHQNAFFLFVLRCCLSVSLNLYFWLLQIEFATKSFMEGSELRALWDDVWAGPIMICLHEMDGTYMQVNEAAKENTGFTPKELVGKSPYDFFHPEDRNHILTESHKKAQEGNAQSKPIRYRFRHKSGGYIFLETFTFILNKEGQSGPALMTFSRAQHAVKELQAHLSRQNNLWTQVGALISVGGWEYDVPSQSIWWTSGTFDIYDLREGKAPQSLEESFAYFEAPGKARLQKDFDLCLLKGEPFDLTLPFLSATNKKKWVRCIGMAMPGEPPTEKVFGVIQDISIQIEKQHRQTQMLDFLRQQNERLEQFNFIVSHNLRAPVANLMSLAHLMDDTSLSQEQTQLLHFMKDSLENLGNTLNELSDAVMGLQERNLPRTFVHLKELVNKVIKAHQSQIQVKKVQINTHFDYPKLFYIAQYLESILHNLVSNALKFVSNDRPPVWEIAFEKHKQYHCLRFRDNGLGLDFKKFGDNVFGLHKTFHRDIPGKGLGLFMTRAQVEALGGQIKLSSEPDKGAEFFIIFDKYHFN